MPVAADEDVLRLEVPVDDIKRVQVLERKDDRRKIEARNIGCEPTSSPQVCEKLATGNVGQEHVDVQGVLEGCVEINDKGVSYAREDVALSSDVLHLA